jgi:hypothetical protein
LNATKTFPQSNLSTQHGNRQRKLNPHHCLNRERELTQVTKHITKP